MVNVFFAVFLIFSILYFVNIKNKNISNFIYVLCGLVLVLIAGLRSPGVDNDYYVYREFWRITQIKDTVESSFYYIKIFLKNYLDLDFQSLLLVYAILGVSAKMTAIWKISPVIWGSLLI